MKGSILVGTAALSGAAVLFGQMTEASGKQDRFLARGNDGGTLAGGSDVYDVAICQLSSLSDFGKIGSFPDGTTALAFSTTGQNTGNVQLPWFVSPDVHHPVIAQNMYRINGDGRLEQIGLSWLKHAWFAVQGTSCGSCQSSGTGAILGIGCADTYGASLNADQFWLGPRWEIQPKKHLWMDGMSWNGSHFERNGGNGDSGSHNAVEHRMRVRMGDLVDPDSDYFYEGLYYLNKDLNDNTWNQLQEMPEDYVNNAAHRQVIPNHTGNGTFSFNHTGSSHTYGPVVTIWGDTQTRATPEDDGTVWVSSRAVDVGGGEYRYEYAVFNFNLDPEVGSFAVPVPAGVTVSDVGFHAPRDGYWIDANTFVNEAEDYDYADWTTTQTGGMLVYSPPSPPVGVANANSIRYGTTYTFWFTADAAPTDVEAVMTPYQADATVPELTAAVRGPEATGDPATLTDFDVTRGEYVSGALADLTSSDDSTLRVNSEIGFTAFEPNLAELTVGATSPHADPAQIDVTVELRVNNPNGSGKIRLFDYDANSDVLLGTFAVPQTDTTKTLSTQDNPGRFVRNGDNRVQMRIRTVVPATFTAAGFDAFHDVVGFEMIP